MPTYEYLCEKCGNEFETFQPISAKPLKICPEDLCAQKKWGRGKVKKKISAGAGLLFKGSGFYITDYRSEKYKDAAKKESSPASTAENKSAKTETKPASPKSAAKAEK
jgi:putative FmdB family regulatory protein